MRHETKSGDFENKDSTPKNYFSAWKRIDEAGEGGGRGAERESYGRLVTTFLMAVRLVFKRLSA